MASGQAVHDSCYQGDDSVLKSLVEIADTAPKYLRPHLEATLQLSLKVSQWASAFPGDKSDSLHKQNQTCHSLIFVFCFFFLRFLTSVCLSSSFVSARPSQLCADTNLTNMQRQLALEVIVTLSETAAAMLRKHTAIVAQAGEHPGHLHVSQGEEKKTPLIVELCPSAP